MKIQYLFDIFIIFSLIFPSIFDFSYSSNYTFSFFNSFTLLFYLFFIIFMYIRTQQIKKQSPNLTNQIKHKFSIFHLILSAIILEILLLMNSTIWNFVASFFKNPPEIEFKLSENIFFQIFNICLGIIISASYEEVLFRLYAPNIIQKIFTNKILCTGAECIIILLFAFSHMYLGYAAVLNAFFAGLLFRLYIRYTNSLLPNILVHCIYNFIQYFMLFKSLS